MKIKECRYFGASPRRASLSEACENLTRQVNNAAAVLVTGQWLTPSTRLSNDLTLSTLFLNSLCSLKKAQLPRTALLRG